MINPSHILPETQTEGYWDLRDLFTDDNAWGAELRALEAQLPHFESFRSRLTNPDKLLEYLERDNDFTARYLRLSRYAFFRRHTSNDTSDATHLTAQVKAFWSRWAKACDFGESEIRRMDQRTFEAALTSQPQLMEWQCYLEQLRHGSPRTLSELEESLLGQLTVPLDLTRHTTDLLVADIQIPQVATSAGTLLDVNVLRLGNLYRHPERGVREQARAQAFETLGKYRKTFAQTLNISVTRLVSLARLRGFGSSLAAALEPEDLNEATFDHVIDAFERNHMVWQRCFEARKSMLKLDTLQPFDLIATVSGGMKGIAYETAVEWICAALEPMGESYVETLRRGLTIERWVRWSGDGRTISADMAYPTYGANPRVQVHYDGTLRSVSLLAHEIGHAMHYWHFGRSQPFHYARSSRLVAESIANFHQAMLRSYILETVTDERVQRAVIEEELDFYHNYYFTKPVTSKLEYLIHEHVWNQRPLTADWLDQTTERVFRQAYGHAVQFDPYVAAQWIGLSSLGSNFYNFQYLPGFAIGANLAVRLRTNEVAPSAIIALLEVGTSLPLAKGLALAAVNLEDPMLLERGFKALDDLATRLRRWS
jgi:oligoendopeptidase F